MLKITEKKRRDFQTVSLLFFFISFIGWVFETCVCLIQSGAPCDRGFLFLPICPVYGAPVCLIYLFFGRPSDGLFYRLSFKRKGKSVGQVRVLNKLISILAYFLTACIIATLAELFVGLVLESKGVSLWSYGGGEYSYKGIISLPVSLLWGVLISLVTQFVLPKVERGIGKIPKRLRGVLTIFLWLATGVDFLFNWWYVTQTGGHFDVVEYFKRGVK